jgi:hypothetical protein
MEKEFNKISNERLLEMLKEKNSLIRELIDDAQRQTVNMGFIEHHREVRVKTVEIKLLIKEIENRLTKLEGGNSSYD